jgi:hypothetical protein
VRGGAADKGTAPQHLHRPQPPPPATRSARHGAGSSHPGTGSDRQGPGPAAQVGAATTVKGGEGESTEKKRDLAAVPCACTDTGRSFYSRGSPPVNHHASRARDGRRTCCSYAATTRRESPAATITAGQAAMPAASSGGSTAGGEERSGRETAQWELPESPRVGSDASGAGALALSGRGMPSDFPNQQ